MKNTSLVLIFIILTLLISCEDPITENIEEEPVVQEWTPVDSASWDGSDTSYNKYGMRKIFADGYSFYPYSREEGRCSLTYNFFIDTTEITYRQFDSIVGDDFPYKEYDTVMVKSDIPVPVDMPLAALFCNERSKRDGLDTVYSYDSIRVDSSSVTSTDYGGYRNYRLYFITCEADPHANGYRVPLSSEWTYAYRGGYQTKFFWGSDTLIDREGAKYGFYDFDTVSAVDHNRVTSGEPVALRQPNPYGLYDMIGNMSECVQPAGISPEKLSGNVVVNPYSLTNQLGDYHMGGGWRTNQNYRDNIMHAYSLERSRTLSTGIRTVLLETIPDYWDYRTE